MSSAYCPNCGWVVDESFGKNCFYICEDCAQIFCKKCNSDHRCPSCGSTNKILIDVNRAVLTMNTEMINNVTSLTSCNY